MLSGEDLREAGRTGQKDHPMGVTQIWLRGLSRGALGIPRTTGTHAIPFHPLALLLRGPCPQCCSTPTARVTGSGRGLPAQHGDGNGGCLPGARRRCICRRRPSRCHLHPRESGTHHRRHPHHTRCPAPPASRWPVPCSGGTESPAPPVRARASVHPALASL